MENTEKRIEQSNEDLDKVVGGVGTEHSGRARVINCDYVNVRDMAGGGVVVGRVKVGTILTYYRRSGSWGYVSNGKVTGYIYKDYYELI